MSSNGVDSSAPGRRRMQVSHWAIRILVALILSVIIVLVFFASGAVSR